MNLEKFQGLQNRTISRQGGSQSPVTNTLLYFSVRPRAVIGQFCGPYFTVRPVNFEIFFSRAPD